MDYGFNPLVSDVEWPPIAEVHGWVSGRSFSEDVPVINLVQAVPDWPPDQGLLDHLAGRLYEPETSVYTDDEGFPVLREALAAEITGIYGGHVRSDQVCITAGCNQAFYVAALALAKAGDEIILPVPYYFNHKMTLDMLGIVPRLLPCRAADRFVPDAGEAAGLINPRTRAIVLVTPNNPTGACYDPGSIEAFYALASRRRIALILDETYRDFLPAGAGPAHGVFTDPSWPGAMIHLYSFSKAYSLTGYRVGALVASAGFVRQAAKIMDCLVICAPAVGQIAARYGIENLGEWRKGKRELLRRRVDAFSREIAGCGSGFEIASIGAFFAYMRHPFAGETAGAVARRLAGHGLLCLPGGTFGPDQDQFLRFAFANVEESVMPAVARRLKIMTD